MDSAYDAKQIHEYSRTGHVAIIDTNRDTALKEVRQEEKAQRAINLRRIRYGERSTVGQWPSEG